MIDRSKLLELKRLAEHFEQRRGRAKERLVFSRSKTYCFAILGLKADFNEYRFDDFVALQPVTEPPGEVELARALRDKHLMSAIGRYSHAICFELAVDASYGIDEQASFNLSWWLLSALRVKSLADFLVPAVADYPWSTIAGLPEDSCQIQLLEDVPQARQFGTQVTITQSDAEWVSMNLVKWAELLEKTNFRLAVECATTHQHHASLRMSTVSLWAGIEALFAITAELRFRLATLAASYLEERGPSRLERYRAVKKLYDFRSKAVHGMPTSDAALESHCLDVRRLLSELLCKIAESGNLPDSDEFDGFVFC